MTLKLAIIIGSTRPGRIGPTVAAWVDQHAREHSDFEVTLLDLKAFDLPLLDEAAHPVTKHYEHEHTKRWSAAIEEADAYLFVTPEYDYFAPASLVNAVQCLSQEWKHKAAGIFSYGGISGGLRSTQTLRVLLSNVGLYVPSESVPVQFVKTHIEDGVFTPAEQTPGSLTKLLAELHKVAGALKTIR